MENENLHFKLITNYTFKDFIEVNKVANKILFLLPRLGVLITQIILSYNYINRCMNTLDITFIDGLIMYLKDPLCEVNILVIILLAWKFPEIITFLQVNIYDKKQVSKNTTRTYNFYDTYYTISSSDNSLQQNLEESKVIIRYSYIYKIYTSDNMYNVRVRSYKVYPLPKRSFVLGDEQEFEDFITNKIKTRCPI